MFPEWLRREMEFRQLSSADPSTLERRREEAASWIKQEVRVTRVFRVSCFVSAPCSERNVMPLENLPLGACFRMDHTIFVRRTTTATKDCLLDIDCWELPSG